MKNTKNKLLITVGLLAFIASACGTTDKNRPYDRERFHFERINYQVMAR